MSKLSNVVKNDVVKKTEYKEIVKKVNNISTTDTSNLVKKTNCNTKTNKIEIKINDHNHDNYFTTQESNKLTLKNFASRLAQANLASKTGIANFVKKTGFDDKLKNLNKKATSNKTKHVLIENELKNVWTFDSSYFIGQSYFGNDGSQSFLIFQPICKAIRTISGLPSAIAEWESKGLSNQKINPTFILNHILSPKLVWMNNSRIRLKFEGSCLEQEKATFNPKI